MSQRMRIIVTGLIAQHPSLGGMSWHYLQYLLGLKDLGHEVYYLEDSGEWPYLTNPVEGTKDWTRWDPSLNVAHLHHLLERYGLADCWMYHFPIKSEWYGLDAVRRQDILKSADILLNVSGTLITPERYREVERLVYIDTDPVFTQASICPDLTYNRNSDFSKRFHIHDLFFSYGECIDNTEFALGLEWLPTRQPIALKEWRNSQPLGADLTTIMSWTSYKPVEWRGKFYGNKDLQMRSIIDLPTRIEAPNLTIALGATDHADWTVNGESKQISPKVLLRENGWNIVDSGDIASSPDSYRDFIISSMGEFSPAKHGYVQGQTGWFSERSACYLASGRPVIVEDTGFKNILPTGKGIQAFACLEEALGAIENLRSNLSDCSKDALDIAHEYFDASKVLAALLDKVVNRS